MDKRAISFFVLSAFIIISWMSIQQIFNPQPNPADRNQELADAEVDGENGDPPGGDEDDGSDPTKSDLLGGDPPSGSSVGDSSGDTTAKPDEGEDGKAADGSDAAAPLDGPQADSPGGEEAPEDTPAPEPIELVTLGSLAEDSETRMLVTFNSVNGTIQRIELNERLPSGRYRYRNIASRSGYLANLGLENDPQGGVVIRVVGPGTPAALAKPSSGQQSVGLQKGDVITQINDQEIGTTDDYFRFMSTVHSGEDISITVARGNRQLAYNTTLTNHPMSMVRPQPTPQDRLKAEGRSDLAFDARPQDPESLVINLGTIENGIWQEFSPSVLTEGWKTEKVVIDGRPAIEFSYTIDFDRVKDSQGRQGKVKVIRRYQLAPLPEESRDDKFYRAYHLTMELEIRNLHSEPQAIVYQLNGPTGAPDEGWWYANKIHGRSTALFYTAGSRDVIGSSEGQKFVFLGGPEIFSNEISKEPEQMDIFVRGADERDRQLRYVGVDAQYFNVSLLPINSEDKNRYTVYSALARTAGPVTSKDKKFRKKSDTTYRLYSEPVMLAPYDEAQPESAYQQGFVLFAGPKEPDLLKEYGLGDAVSYGWFAWFSVPLVWVLHCFYFLVRNYGVSIILLTILVRGMMTPISRKAVRNAQMMQHLQPEMKAIAEKYKEDFEKRGKAQRELFRKYNYNPFGGCLLMFLQLPIFLGLYRALSVDIALRDQALIPGISWCSNLAGPDQLLRWDSWMPSFIASETGWLGPTFNLLPIITVCLFLIQQKLFTPPATDEQTRMTQKMMTYMMLFIGLMFFKVPSGLCIYFITSSLWGIAERKLLPKPSLEKSLAAATTETHSKKKKAGAEATAKVMAERREKEKQRQKKLKNRS